MECGARLRYLWRRAGRQKQVGETDTHTNLRRCLSTLQMTAIGLGSTIGVGIYVLLGVVVRDITGPGVILSFLVVAPVVAPNALILAEFGSIIPQTGGSYTYLYKTVGELAGFLAGWMGMFTVTTSTASSARAWSGFVDSLFNNSIQAFFDDQVGQLDIGPPFARSLDWMAFTFFLVLTVVVSCNIQCSSLVNAVLALLTVAILILIAITGFVAGDVHRLVDPDNGGFLPYGFGGVIVSATAVFYAFDGYYVICFSAEEAKDPAKSIPRAILIVLLTVTIVYCGTAAGTLCLIPYTEIDSRAPIPSAFAYQGITWARYIVTVGPAVAITNLGLVNLYAQSRAFYRMAEDGLWFKSFAYIHPVTKVPLLGVVVSGIMGAVFSLLLELKDLVQCNVLTIIFQNLILAPAIISLRTTDWNRSVPREQGYNTFRDHGASGQHTGPHRQDNPLRTRQTSGHGVSELMNAGCPPIEEGNKSLQDDDSPGQKPYENPLASAACSHVTDGDISFGAHLSEHEASAEFRKVPFDSCQQTRNSYQHQDVDAKDAHQGVKTELSQRKSGTVFPLQGNHKLEPSTEEQAEASHFSEELSQTRSESEAPRTIPDNEHRGNMGCHEVLMGKLLRMLTTPRCLILLVTLLATLSLQLGLAWQDLQRLKLLAVISTTVIVIIVIFLCEVLRKRCGPGRHEGFKVPGVPYTPALAFFLNMLLLVTGADYVGLLEIAVLAIAGTMVYVLMVMMQWSRNQRLTFAFSAKSMECRTLLAHRDQQ